MLTSRWYDSIVSSVLLESPEDIVWPLTILGFTLTTKQCIPLQILLVIPKNITIYFTSRKHHPMECQVTISLQTALHCLQITLCGRTLKCSINTCDLILSCLFVFVVFYSFLLATVSLHRNFLKVLKQNLAQQTKANSGWACLILHKYTKPIYSLQCCITLTSPSGLVTVICWWFWC